MVDKILVADDEPDILNLAKTILEGEGYKVITASNGEECLLKTEKEMPDLILLDVVMPGKSGLEACKILKTQQKTNHIPVIIFTVLDRDVDRNLIKNTGANFHIPKPFSPDQLINAIKQQLESSGVFTFSKQLGVSHDEIKGKKFLLEFDPSTQYERFVRSFAVESSLNDEKTIILTKRGGRIEKALAGDKAVDLIDPTPQTGTVFMPTTILKKYPDGSLGLIYDSITDLALSADMQLTYKFVRNALTLLSEQRITALFLFNPKAHDSKDISGLRGLFSSQVSYGKEGVETLSFG